jgi:hypothetical protein
MNVNLNPLGLNLDPLNVGGNIQALVQDLNNMGTDGVESRLGFLVGLFF